MDPGGLPGRLLALVQNFRCLYWYCVTAVFAGGQRAAGGRPSCSGAEVGKRPLPRLDQTTFTIRSSGGYQIVSFQDSPGAIRAKEARICRREREARDKEETAATWRLVNRVTNAVIESRYKDRVAQSRSNADGSQESRANKDFTNTEQAGGKQPITKHCIGDKSSVDHTGNRDPTSKILIDQKDAENESQPGQKQLTDKDQARKKELSNKGRIGDKGNYENWTNKDRRACTNKEHGKEANEVEEVEDAKNIELERTETISNYKDLNCEYKTIYKDSKREEHCQSGTKGSRSRENHRARTTKRDQEHEKHSDAKLRRSTQDRGSQLSRGSKGSKLSSGNHPDKASKCSNKDKESGQSLRESHRRSSRRQVIQTDWVTVQTTAEKTLKI